MDPVEVVTAASAVVRGRRTRRTSRKGNASNVVLLTGSQPRPLHGYEIVCTVINDSEYGISDVFVRIRMRSGEFELDGEIENEVIVPAGRAVPGGKELELKLPHVVRFGASTFDPRRERGPGYVATLYWRDESGKRWRRVDGSSAKSCRSREFPDL